MSTPEKPRPSLADTLQRIDQALAEQEPRHRVLHIDPAQPDTVFEATVVRDGDTFTLTKPGVYQFGGTVPQPPVHHLPGPPGPTCPGCTADAARPGWLARALNRLFG